MNTPREIEIPTDDTYPVRGDLYLPNRSATRGVVLLCHGFKGYKSWGFLPYLAERLRGVGLASLSLDFSHNGTFPAPNGAPTSGAGSLYARPDLFERNTLHREFRDVKRVLAHVVAGELSPELRGPLPIGLFGHSRGGVAATLNAIEQPEVKALCTWSTADDPDFFTPDQKTKWRRDGKYPFVVSTDGTQLAMGLRYLDDLEDNHEFYLLRERVKELQVPHLIVHGKADVVVDVASALALHESEQQLKDKRMLIVPTGHTFGLQSTHTGAVTHPSTALQQAGDETVAWFDTHLAAKGTA
jgi:pimeloyl-ACP methyl ester carboxylesterase